MRKPWSRLKRAPIACVFACTALKVSAEISIDHVNMGGPEQIRILTRRQAVWVQSEAGRPSVSDSTCAVLDKSQLASSSILASAGVVSAQGSRSCGGTSGPNNSASSCTCVCVRLSSNFEAVLPVLCCLKRLTTLQQ